MTIPYAAFLVQSSDEMYFGLGYAVPQGLAIARHRAQLASTDDAAVKTPEPPAIVASVMARSPSRKLPPTARLSTSGRWPACAGRRGLRSLFEAGGAALNGSGWPGVLVSSKGGRNRTAALEIANTSLRSAYVILTVAVMPGLSLRLGFSASATALYVTTFCTV